MGCFISKPAVSGPVESKAAVAQPNNKARIAQDHNVLNHAEQAKLQDLYTLGKVLGKGQFGTTRLATEKATGKQLACKSIAKRQMKTIEDVEDVRREVQIMHHLKGHPHVVQLIEAYEDRHDVHLVMELCSGGELFDRIVAVGHYSEHKAAACCRDILKVVAHCHSMGVVHRDLKPENFLLDSKAQDATIKATDFGLSVFFHRDKFLHDVVGSAFYVAPEVLNKKYSFQCDIWSVGVILYILLSGVPPFWGDNERQIFNSIRNDTVDFQSEPWPKISNHAKDVVKRMLNRDPEKRATAEEILSHEWMRENGVASDEPLGNEVLNRIKQFAAMNRLKKEALKVIACNLPKEEIAGLKELFLEMDQDKSGTITVEEMRQGLKRKGNIIPEDDLQRIMDATDVDGNGTIDYQEFLAATMNMSQMAKLDNLEQAFRHFDSDNDGYITVEELRQVFKRSTQAGEQIDFEELLSSVDKDQNGKIEYQEFVEMMTQQMGRNSPGVGLRGRLVQ